MTTTHRPWKPDRYDNGILGLKVAIVGFSHYLGSGDDHPNLTKDVLRKVLNETLQRNSFFSAVSGYFQFDSPPEFWNRVAFFNFLPCAVGPSDCKYSSGTSAQIEAGKERFLRTLTRLGPDCTIVFTTKGWRHCPSTIEQLNGRPRPQFISSPNVTWGRYRAGTRDLPVFGMRHPQGAPKSEMTRAVDEALRIAKRLKK